MMRTRFADPIRASSPPGLHQQAGHMTASDLCAARQMIRHSPVGALAANERRYVYRLCAGQGANLLLTRITLTGRAVASV